MSDVILSIIGTAQDGGIPHPNCFCNNCKQAWQNSKFKRTASSLAIILPENNEWHLIDATPDIKEQMGTLQLRYHLEGILMSSIFLTHAHMGHLPGLLYLGKEGINSNMIPVFTGPKMKSMLANNAPWKLLTNHKNIELKELKNNKIVNLNGKVSIKSVLVPHRNEFTETFAFWIIGPNKKVLYIPDIDKWSEWDINILDAATEADICLLDGTFHSAKDLEHIGREFEEIPHPLMTTTMEMLQSIATKTKIIFTHLNHSNPIVNKYGDERNELLKRGFFVAEDGMEINI